MGKWIRHIVFILLVLALCLPVIQQKTGFLEIKNLRGAGDPPNYPAFTLKTWADGSFQAGTDKAIEQGIGFRPLLIRLKNQLEYSLFRKANARGVVVGKKRYLFEEDYLRAHRGGDYPGDWYWKEKFRRARMVRDTLASLGVNIAVVVEPSKATYNHEYIPDRMKPVLSGSPTNYGSILKGCQSESIHFLDLNNYFYEIRDEVPFPLFPKGGIHWSYYGMLTAMDTLLPLVEEWSAKSVPELVIGAPEPTKKLRGTDGDLAELMNVLVKPSHPKMAYPEVTYVQVDDSLKPRVLAISDSFYFNIMNAGIPENSYANSAFWYYNVEIYPETWSARKDTTMINFKEEVESMDLILVMITERFFYKFAWDFFDRLYDTYFPAAPVDYRYRYTGRIISHYKWFDEVVAESANKGISVEQGLEDHSGYQFWQDEQNGLLTKNQSYYEMKILHNDDWMKKVREKAEKSGISVDQQIQLEAAWTLSNSKN